MMHIGMILHSRISDHQSIYFQGIAKFLVRKFPCKVEILLCKGINATVEKKGYNLKTVLPYGYYSFLGQSFFSFNLFKLLSQRSRSYHIVHVRNPISTLIPAVAYRKLGGKYALIYDYRGPWLDFAIARSNRGDFYFPKKLSSFLASIEIRLMKKCSHIITLSSELRHRLLALGVNKEISVVPEGVDLEKFRPIVDARSQCCGDVRGPIIGYVGAISKLREVHIFLEAFQIVKKEHKDAKLLLVGKIEEPNKFWQMVRLSELEGSLIYAGEVDHDRLPYYISAFDIAISLLPELSIYQVSCPIKVLEYMACGRPIVASDIAAHRNILTDGLDALLARPSDSKDFAEKITILLEDEKKRLRLGRNARKKAEHHSFGKLADKVFDIYTELIERRDKGA